MQSFWHTSFILKPKTFIQENDSHCMSSPLFPQRSTFPITAKPFCLISQPSSPPLCVWSETAFPLIKPFRLLMSLYPLSSQKFSLYKDLKHNNHPSAVSVSQAPYPFSLGLSENYFLTMPLTFNTIFSLYELSYFRPLFDIICLIEAIFLFLSSISSFSLILIPSAL